MIVTRLRQLGFAPELVIGMGFGSLMIACIGLCGLNYSSSQMLYFYAFSCFTFVLLLVIGMPEIIYKPPASVAGRLVAKVIEVTTTTPKPIGQSYTTRSPISNNPATPAAVATANDQVLQVFPSYLFRDIFYFSLISLLLLLIVISIIFAQHLSKKKLNFQMKANSIGSLSAGARFLAMRHASRQQLQGKGSLPFSSIESDNHYHPSRQYHQYQQQSYSCELMNASNGQATNDNYQSTSTQRHSAMARLNPSLTLHQQYQQQQKQHNSASAMQNPEAFNDPNDCGNIVVARSRSLANERSISDKLQCLCNKNSQSMSRSSDIHKNSASTIYHLNNAPNVEDLSSDDHIAGWADNDRSLLASSCKSVAGDASDLVQLHHRIQRNRNYYSPKYIQNRNKAICTDDDGDGDAEDDSEEIEMINANRGTSNDAIIVQQQKHHRQQQEYLIRRLSRQSMQYANRNDVPPHPMGLTSTSACLSCNHSLINNRNNHPNNNHCNNSNGSTLNNFSHKSLVSNYIAPRSSIANVHSAARRVSEVHRVAGSNQQLCKNRNIRSSHEFLYPHSQYRQQAIRNDHTTDKYHNMTNATSSLGRGKNANHEDLRCTCVSAGIDLLPLHLSGEYRYIGTDVTADINANCIKRPPNFSTSNNSLFSRGGFKTTPGSPIEYLHNFNNPYPFKTTDAIASGSHNDNQKSRLRPRPHSANTKLISPQTIDMSRGHTANSITKKKKQQSGASSVMAVTAAAAAALFGGVVDTSHIEDGSFDEVHQMPTDLDEFPLDSADCQCVDMSGATNGHHHLEVPLLGIDSEHTIGCNGPREPLLDFGPLMMSHNGHTAATQSTNSNNIGNKQ